MNFALLLPLFERLLTLRSSANVRTPEGRAAAFAEGTTLFTQIREMMGVPASVPMPTEEEMLQALEDRESAHRANQE